MSQQMQDFEKQPPPLDEKHDLKSSGDIDYASDLDSSSSVAVLDNERDIATHIISVQDDPTLNPWTFRAFVIGIGLSAFGGVLGSFLC